jgi:aspartate/methionine/tyrosine aminotransferase
MFSLSPIKVAESLVRAHPGSVSMAQGIPDFPLSEEIYRELHETIRRGVCNAYLPPEGLPELRQLLKQQEDPKQFRGADLIITNGAIEGIVSTLLAVTAPGDEVITSDPGYASFVRAIATARLKSRTFRYHRDGCTFRGGEFLNLINSRTRIVLFAQPNNPDGHLIRREELEDLIRLAHKHSFLILSDETYRDFVWGSGTMISPWDLPGGPEVTIRITSYSKTFGVTGWRVGVLAAQRRVLEKILPLHDTCVTCAPAVSQYLALLLERARKGLVAQNRSLIEKRLRFVIDELSPVQGFEDLVFPEAGYYLFPRLASGESGDRFAQRLFERARVAVVPGSAFGSQAKDRIRISVASFDENLIKAVSVIQASFAFTNLLVQNS